jgi:hypothetical protein
MRSGGGRNDLAASTAWPTSCRLTCGMGICGMETFGMEMFGMEMFGRRTWRVIIGKSSVSERLELLRAVAF